MVLWTILTGALFLTLLGFLAWALAKIDRALNGQPQQSWPRWAEMVGLASATAV